MCEIKDRKWECVGLLQRPFFGFENIAGNNLRWALLPMRNTCYGKLLKANVGHWPSRCSLIKLQAPHQKRQLLKEGSPHQAKTFYLSSITWVGDKTQVSSKSLVHAFRGCTIIMIDYKSPRNVTFILGQSIARNSAHQYHRCLGDIKTNAWQLFKNGKYENLT